MTRPRLLIESWLPVATPGIESRRESAPIPGQFPKLKTRHLWSARHSVGAGRCSGAGKAWQLLAAVDGVDGDPHTD